MDVIDSGLLSSHVLAPVAFESRVPRKLLGTYVAIGAMRGRQCGASFSIPRDCLPPKRIAPLNHPKEDRNDRHHEEDVNEAPDRVRRGDAE